MSYFLSLANEILRLYLEDNQNSLKGNGSKSNSKTRQSRMFDTIEGYDRAERTDGQTS